ncbi:MAG TPA: hypothetical protein VHB21_20135, partial [Minicystis sp.]|nr:hypothetical protein [Minicystis sp.]
ANQASTVSLPARELPAAPAWMTSGLEPEPVRSTAVDRVRLYARPKAKGAPGIDSDRFGATYYRVALGFEATQGEIAWAHLGDADYLGGAAFAGGLALCDAKGKVTLFDAKTGAVSAERSLGRALDACVVQADALAITPKPASLPLAEQIAACVTSPEQELATVQKFLLRELVTLKDPAVTKALIGLASNPRTSPFLAADARSALAAQRTGADAMLAALSAHVDWLAGKTATPPVAPLADALGAMKEKRAAPLLAAHLLDPSDSPEDVQHAAAALATLADKAQVEALKSFFAMYRCSTGLEGQDAIDLATTSVAKALVRLGEGGVVAAAAADPTTSPGVRARIANLKK